MKLRTHVLFSAFLMLESESNGINPSLIYFLSLKKEGEVEYSPGNDRGAKRLGGRVSTPL